MWLRKILCLVPYDYLIDVWPRWGVPSSTLPIKELLSHSCPLACTAVAVTEWLIYSALSCLDYLTFAVSLIPFQSFAGKLRIRSTSDTVSAYIHYSKLAYHTGRLTFTCDHTWLQVYFSRRHITRVQECAWALNSKPCHHYGYSQRVILINDSYPEKIS